jgi:hypothetical protein
MVNEGDDETADGCQPWHTQQTCFRGLRKRALIELRLTNCILTQLNL